MEVAEILRQAAIIIDRELECDYRLFLFGSRAQGTHDERSDIDIGILPDTPVSGKQLSDIQEELEQIPTLLKIDVIDFSLVDDAFKKIALKQTLDIKL